MAEPLAPTRLTRLGVDFPFMVAPMVGVTNLPFRELVRSYLPPGLGALLFTEMLSSRRLACSRLNTLDEVRFKPGERHLVTQLLANEERFIAPSMQRLQEAEVFGVDINMGCPVSHTLQYNWGVKLLGDVRYAAEVVAITKKNSKVPVSVKLRASPGDKLDREFLENFTHALESAGADWITIHARTQAQKHSGTADWSVVGEIASRRKIPVVANGDIQTAADALGAIQNFGADGAMIGRAAVVRPWILAQIAERMGLMQGAPKTPEEEGRAYLEACRTLLRNYREYFQNEAIILKQFRFFVGHSVKWFLFGHSFWSEITGKRTVQQLQDFLDNYPHVDQLRMAERIKN